MSLQPYYVVFFQEESINFVEIEEIEGEAAAVATFNTKKTEIYPNKTRFIFELIEGKPQVYKKYYSKHYTRPERNQIKTLLIIRIENMRQAFKKYQN